MWPSTLKTKNDFFEIWYIATADLTEVIQYSYKPEKKSPFITTFSKSFLHSPAIKFRKWLRCWENDYSLDAVSYLISSSIHVTIDRQWILIIKQSSINFRIDTSKIN